MSKLVLDISMSLDGYVAGPDPSDQEPLGQGGELLHEWAFAQRAFRGVHDLDGGETSEENAMVEAHLGRIGATIMGRRMFSGGAGAWEDDGHANGWWGDEPPFRHPVFVLTHHAREPLELEGTTFTFVTDGIASALEQARRAAGDRDVTIGGGAEVAQQYLMAGLVDELRLHVAPVLLGAGRRLFEHHLEGGPRRLELTRSFAGASGATHLLYAAAS